MIYFWNRETTPAVTYFWWGGTAAKWFGADPYLGCGAQGMAKHEILQNHNEKSCCQFI